MLVQDGEVGCMQTLGDLFDSEFNFLSFFQVTETVALNSGEMDENIRSIFAGDKAVAFGTIEPFDRTIYTFRHCFCLLWQSKKFRCSVLFHRRQTKQLTSITVSCCCSSTNANLLLSYKA